MGNHTIHALSESLRGLVWHGPFPTPRDHRAAVVLVVVALHALARPRGLSHVDTGGWSEAFASRAEGLRWTLGSAVLALLFVVCEFARTTSRLPAPVWFAESTNNGWLVD